MYLDSLFINFFSIKIILYWTQFRLRPLPGWDMQRISWRSIVTTMSWWSKHLRWSKQPRRKTWIMTRSWWCKDPAEIQKSSTKTAWLSFSQNFTSMDVNNHLKYSKSLLDFYWCDWILLWKKLRYEIVEIPKPFVSLFSRFNPNCL